MSLVQFKARNHTQQVARKGANEKVDDRQTTPEVFDPLMQRFGFSVDVAALPHNAKCKRFYTPLEDGLAQSWAGERVWCNPPYSSIEPWIVKAWAEEAEAIVMLDVARMAHGVPHRVDRVRALGNALVPQVAEWIGRRIIEHEERELADAA